MSQASTLASSIAPACPEHAVYTETQSQRAKSITLGLIKELKPIARSRCRIRLWDGSFYPNDEARDCTVTLRHPGSMRGMFIAHNGITLAETYIRDLWDWEGDREAMFELIEAIGAEPYSTARKLHLGAQLLRLPKPHTKQPRRWRARARLHGKPHSIERSREAVAYHYNVGTDFYAQFLDANMIYSSGVYEENDTLEEAQIRKLDGICQSLKLQSGQHVLDVGCGWGGFILHAARNYGVQVTGITLSQPQCDEANRRIAAAGLSETCRAIVCDYREITRWGEFDAIASIEMFEHVGREMLETYFDRARRLLKPGGLFLNQGTTVQIEEGRKNYPSFIKQYVFPDGEVLPIEVSIAASEKVGFEVLSNISIREHYVKTCAAWVKNLEDNYESASAIVGDPTWRIWHLYTAISGYSFRTGRCNCYQTLMRKSDLK